MVEEHEDVAIQLKGHELLSLETCIKSHSTIFKQIM